MSRVEIPEELYFITFPQNVSWSKDSVSSSTDTYGSNSPYLQYGTTKLRSLSLGSCLFEGFSDGKSVEGNIRELEAAMQMVITDFGTASPYCWDAYAGGKWYGTFVINSVSVQEQMRDIQGNATRANVDISLTEVPGFQVSSGIDITAQAIQGAADEKYADALEQGKNSESSKQDDKVAGEKPKGDYKVGEYEYDAATGRPISGPGISEGPQGSGANTNNAFDKAGL